MAVGKFICYNCGEEVQARNKICMTCQDKLSKIGMFMQESTKQIKLGGFDGNR